MEINEISYNHNDRVLMANRLRKLRVKIWCEMYDNRDTIEPEEFSQLDEACCLISNVISNLSQGEPNEETE